MVDDDAGVVRAEMDGTAERSDRMARERIGFAMRRSFCATVGTSVSFTATLCTEAPLALDVSNCINGK